MLNYVRFWAWYNFMVVIFQTCQPSKNRMKWPLCVAMRAVGAEAVLEQINKPVLYISRTLSQTERKYDQLQRYMVIIFRTCQPSKNPLRNLRARIKKFNWSSEQDSEFCQLKAELNGGNVFTKFKPNEMATLRCDASPIGAEAVLKKFKIPPVKR